MCRFITRDDGLADDAVQAAWDIAWRKLGSLRDPARLRPWLVSVAANEAKRLAKRQHRRHQVEIHVDASTRPGGVDPATGIDRVDLRRAMAHLDPDDRALLAMRYVAAVVRSVATKSPMWRFWSMFTATKTLAATAIIALFGGFLLIGPLQSDQATTVVPGAEVEAVTPVEFEARWMAAGAAERGTVESHEDGLVTYRDARSELWVDETTDPRLDGTINLVHNTAVYSGVRLSTGYFPIENDDGAWQERPTSVIRLTGEMTVRPATAIFDGEGAYEGLIAAAEVAYVDPHYDVQGAIFEATVPPAPEIRDLYD